MSRLGDLETAIVNRIAAATSGGSAVFAVVRGASGPGKAILLDRLKRERPPAAYVSFIKEPTDFLIDPGKLGPQFSVFVTARMLRQNANPRLGDSTALGAFALIDTVKTQLDTYSPSSAYQLQSTEISFLDADDRVAVYELGYRAWPYAALAAPGAPQNLTVIDLDGTIALKFLWDEPEVSATEGKPDFYRIHRKGPDDDDFSLFETGVKNPTDKQVITQPSGQTWGYYLTACNTVGESSPSNTLWWTSS